MFRAKRSWANCPRTDAPDRRLVASDADLLVVEEPGVAPLALAPRHRCAVCQLALWPALERRLLEPEGVVAGRAPRAAARRAVCGAGDTLRIHPDKAALAERTPRPRGLRPERPHHLPGGDTWPVRQNAGRVPRQARLAVKARADDK